MPSPKISDFCIRRNQIKFLLFRTLFRFRLGLPIIMLDSITDNITCKYCDKAHFTCEVFREYPDYL